MAEQKAPLCDLVLQGGVTSGLLYLGVIAELSRHYEFKNLGGTSSGAISAAAAAIAQRAKLELLKKPHHERQVDPEKPFDELRKFPSELAKQERPKARTALFRMFQPQEGTVRSYRILTTGLDHWAARKRSSAIAWVLWETVVQFPLAAIAGAAPGTWLFVTYIRSLLETGSISHAVNAALAIFLALVCGLIFAVLWAGYKTVKAMVQNHFGLCNGMQGAGGPNDQPLTVKMHTLFNALLGRKAEDRPVIFGELWGKDGEREIELQVITTAVNLRRPFQLPSDPDTDPLREFFYDPDEWKDFFPSPVMQWLKDKDRLMGDSRVTNKKGAKLLALPLPALLPVIVPVRFSCGFPGLLSAVPMYYIGAKNNAKHRKGKPGAPSADNVSSGMGSGAGGDGPIVATKVYFADGGITSNCPVHLFDAPLPGHPTFGVALDRLESSERRRRYRIHLPAASDELKAPVRPTESVLSFASTIVSTAVDWQDGLQRALPGYRERVVNVSLKPEDGGLNLAMKPETIRWLPRLGQVAALTLLREFTTTRAEQRSNSWDRHRWIRLRSTLAAAQRYLNQLHRAQQRTAEPRLDDGSRPALSDREMLDLEPSTEPALADSAAVARAKALLEGLFELTESDAALKRADLSNNAPQPTPRLRMSPPW